MIPFNDLTLSTQHLAQLCATRVTYRGSKADRDAAKATGSEPANMKGNTMSVQINAKMEGSNLVITVPLQGAKPYVSKSAIQKATEKAIKAGTDPAAAVAALTAEAIATSGGFQRLGDYKFSLNVNKA